jgi:hypothetical protein
MKIKRKGKNDYNFIKMKNNRIQLPTRELVEIKLQLKLINVMAFTLKSYSMYLRLPDLLSKGAQKQRNSFIKREYESKEFGRNL